jgi:hypothetical protein
VCRRVCQAKTTTIVLGVDAKCPSETAMSKTTEERIESALSQLLSRLLPAYPGEDEAIADDRFEEAYNYAVEVLDGCVQALPE